MRIFALRPLRGCHGDFLKVLSDEDTYYFYNNYSFLKNDELIINSSLPEDFFAEGKMKINICAVVGRNGSGKSTLVELLFRVINNVAHARGKTSHKLHEIPGLRVEIFFETEGRPFKLRIYDKKLEFYGLDKGSNRLNKEIKNFDIKDFFFTIAVNFSHYAYNSLDFNKEGPWLEMLFKKNDGYQIPLVLNPLRENGIIDINNENHLIKSRLIANLAKSSEKDRNHFRNLSNGLEADYLELGIVRNQEERTIYKRKKRRQKGEEENVTLNMIFNDNQRDELCKSINRFFKFSYSTIDKTYYKEVLDYLLYKIISIADGYYNQYEVIFIKQAGVFNSVTLDRFLSELSKDRTHVTLKFRQTINLLRFKHLPLESKKVTLNDLADKINKIMEKKLTVPVEREELVPPPIFTTEIFLKKLTAPDVFVDFKKLSSGEKQMIYSTSAMLYHLNNVDSIPNNSKKKVAYRNVNIVLEEIELYAHPEMQRMYVSYILKSIENLQLKRTHSINLCLVTHSPFILTNIPHCNVLFLGKDGRPLNKVEELKTFGANIHELLANSFFLGEGTIGTFAQKNIDEMIKVLNSDVNLNFDKQSELKYKIEMIGEPFLRSKMFELYFKKFEREKRIRELETQLDALKS